MPKVTKPQGDAKRHPLNMRTTRETRERLETAAAASGRSLAQEVEARLERSFEYDRRLSDEFGDQRIYALVRMIAGALDSMRLTHPKKQHWMDSQVQFDAALLTVVRIMEIFRPVADKSDASDGWDKVIANINAETHLKITLEALPDRVKDALGDLRQRVYENLEKLHSRQREAEERSRAGRAARARRPEDAS